MSTLTVTAKGQVTLRKDLLKHLAVRPGERIAVHKLPGGRIELRAARPSAFPSRTPARLGGAATGKISDVFDLFKKNGPSLSIEEINKAAGRGWAGKR